MIARRILSPSEASRDDLQKFAGLSLTGPLLVSTSSHSDNTANQSGVKRSWTRRNKVCRLFD